MPTIDESVVKLSLDDSQFDKASDRTIRKLDELRDSLRFDGAVDGFKEIEKAAEKTDLSSLEKGVVAVSNQFNALYTIADQVFRRIVNGAIDAGEKTIKSLTIDNISAGWSKYAEKTSAVQTIMAATRAQFEDTGEQMAYVEKQLEKLNWFTDETSYKFVDMTTNIGRFTSAGISLDQAVTSMEGIATWAAISGANASKASSAMDALAQSMGTGYLQLRQFMRLETINMANQEFKQTAIDTAIAMGTLKEVAEGTYQTLSGHTFTNASFREYLKDAWLTTDVLNATLGKYGDFTDALYRFTDEAGLFATEALGYINDYVEGTLDMEEAMRETGLSAEELGDWLDKLSSDEYELGRTAFRAAQEAKTFQEAVEAAAEAVSSGWMQTFEYIFGNYEEAKKIWSDLAEGLYEIFVESGNMRNGVLRDWKAFDGRKYLIEGLYNLFGKLRDSFMFFKETLNEVFPQKTAKELVAMTEGFKELMEVLTPSENIVNSVHNALTLLLTILQKVGQVVIVIFAGLEPIWELLAQLSSAFIGLIGDISALLGLNLNKWLSADALTNLYKIIYSISTVIANLARGSLIVVLELMGRIIGFGQDIYTTFKNGEGGIKGFIDAIVVNFNNLFNSLSNGKGAAGYIDSVILAIKNLFDSVISGESIFGGFFTGIYNLGKAVFGPITDLIANIFNSFSKENIDSNPLVSFFMNVGSAIGDSGIIENIGLAASALLQFVSDAIGGIDGIRNAGTNLHQVIQWFMDQFGILWDWFVEQLSSMSLRDVADVALIVVIAELISAFKNLTIAAKGSVAGFNGILTSIKQAIDTFSGNGLNNMSASINTFLANTKYLQMAVAMGVLVNGLMELSTIDTGKLGTAVAAIAAVTGMLAGLMAIMKKFSSETPPTPSGGGDDNSTTINIPGLQSMLQFAIGIRLLVSAVSEIASIVNSGEKGLSGYADLIAGLGGLALVMVEIGAFAYVINKLKLEVELTKAAATIALFALGLTAMIVPVAMFSTFNWDDWAQGIGGAAALMISFAAAAKLMGKVDVKSILAAAAAIDLVAVGLTLLSIPVFALSFLDLGGLGKGILAVTAMLAGLTAACVVISKWGSGNATGMLAAGAAMISFSAAVLILTGAMKVIETISWDGIAKGITVLLVAFAGFAGLALICKSASAGLLSLAAVIISVGASFALFAIGVKTLVDAVAEFIVIVGVIMLAGETIGDDFPAMVEKGFDNVELVIRAFLRMIPNLVSDIAAAIYGIIIAVKYGFLKAMPDILNGLLIIGQAILELIAKFAGPAVHALADLFDGMAKELPYLFQAAGRFVDEFFTGLGVLVWNALIGLIRGLFSAVGFGFLGDWIGDAMRDMGKNVSAGMGIGIEEGGKEVVEAGEEVMKNTLDTMQEAGGINSPSWITTLFGSFLGEGVVNGLESTFSDVENAGFGTMSSLFSGMMTGLEEGGSSLSDGMNSLLKMLGMKAEAAVDIVGFTYIGVGKDYDVGVDPDFRKGLKPQEQLRDAKAAIKKTVEEATSISATGGMDAGSAFASNFNDSASKGVSSGKSGGGGSGKSSAEKQKTVVEQIVESYEEILKELDYLDKKHKGEFNLWDALNQDVSDLEKNSAKLEYTNRQIETQLKRSEVAQEKYEKIVKAMGESSQEARDAEIEWIEQQVSLAQLQNESIEIQAEIIGDAAKQLELQEKNAELTYNLWVSTNQKASEMEYQEKKLEYTMLKLEYASNKVTEATEDYNEALEKYGEDAAITKELLNELIQTQIDYADISVEVTEIQERIVEIGKEQAEIAAENASLEYDIWLQTHKNASQAEKEAKETEEYMRHYERSIKKLEEETENWHKACEKYGEESLEAAEAYNVMLEAQKESNENLEKLRSTEQAHLDFLTQELAITARRADLEDELWEAANENATKQEKHARKMQTLVRNQAIAQQELVLLEKEYNRLLEEQGDDAQDTRNAYNAIIEQQVKIAGYLKEQKDLAEEALQIEMEELEFEEKRLEIADQMWQTVNEHASESEKYAHEIEQINAKMVLSMKELNKLSEQYNKQIERYGQNSEEARAAWESYANKQREIIELQNERKAIELEIIENELELTSILESRAKTEKELWEALNQDATDAQKNARNMTYQMQSLEYASERLRVASKKYNYSLKMYGEEAKQTQELFNEMLEAQVAYAQTYNELKTAQLEIIEKNNEILEQLSYSEKLLDYGYNMWEKLNDDISDAQKIEAQIKKLNQSLVLQVQRANYYGAEWKKAVAKYGQNSSEAQEAYLNYLEALYNALDMQSDLSNKEKELTDLRTENAQRLKDAWDEVMAKDLAGGTSIYEELLEMGLSEKEIEDYVKEKAGYIEDAIGTEMDFSIESMQSKAEDALRQWGLTWIDGTYDVADTVVETAGSCMDDMTDIIEQGAKEGEEAAEAAMEEIEKIVEEGAEDCVEATENGMDDMVDAIKDASPEAVSAMEQVIDDVARNATRGKVDEFADIGLFMVLGIQQGILSGRSRVIDAIILVINEAMEAARRAAEIRSPSRITTWMGEMFDAGFVEGIENRAGEIAKALARAVQNGINVMRNIAHTTNTADFAAGLIADGIIGGIEGYSYNILGVGQNILDALADEFDEYVDDLIGENQWLIDALREYGFDETTHGIEFIVSLDADDAKTELERLFEARESDLEYYDELLNMQERNAAKDQKDLAVMAEAQAINRELNRILSSIESYEKQIEDIVSAGRASDYESSIAGKKYEYVQNIYTTKPLSALDVYRSTNSQLLRFTAWR